MLACFGICLYTLNCNHWLGCDVRLQDLPAAASCEIEIMKPRLQQQSMSVCMGGHYVSRQDFPYKMDLWESFINAYKFSLNILFVNRLFWIYLQGKFWLKPFSGLDGYYGEGWDDVMDLRLMNLPTLGNLWSVTFLHLNLHCDNVTLWQLSVC